MGLSRKNKNIFNIEYVILIVGHDNNGADHDITLWRRFTI